MAINPTEARGVNADARLKRLEDEIDGAIRQHYADKSPSGSVTVSLDKHWLNEATEDGQALRTRLLLAYKNAGWIAALATSGDGLLYTIRLTPSV